MTKNKIFPLMVLISFVIGYFMGEDTLLGGKNDYLYHEKYFLNFYEDFLNTIKNYGMDQINEQVRNSPVFYIIFSFFLKMGFDLNHLKSLNLLILIPLIFFFNKCIDLKYKNTSLDIKLYFFSILLLSPTVRTLLIWPYPLLWALTLFIISLFFYLRFKSENEDRMKIKNAYYNIIFLALAAYFTPNYAVFSIYFFYKYFLEYGVSKKILSIFFLNFVIAMPAIYFLFSKNFYLFNSNVYEIDSSLKYNLSNKIIIVTTITFLFFLPLLPKIKKFKLIFTKKNYLSWYFLLILIFAFMNIFYFNFSKGAGGGIFFHLSNILFDNYILIYFVFLVSLIFYYVLDLYNFNNILIFFLLILYNMQFSIYYKYFDPLIFFLILFLIKFKSVHEIQLKKIYKKYAIFYIIFLSLNFAKSYIIY